ncbi:MAG: DUF3313 domain-containing protein [Syntrophaceae bacterium]
MNRAIKLFLVVILGLAVAACATGKQAATTSGTQAGTQAAAPQPALPALEEGGAKNFLGNYYDLMGPGPKGGVKKRWIKQDANFLKYKKVMLDSVVFYLAKNSDYQGIDPVAMKDLADKFNKITIDAIRDKYPVVSEPGPDVVRFRVAITNLEQSRPVLSGLTTVIPIGLGISILKRGVAGSWSGSGATGMAFMALDSTTNEVVAVAEDYQSAGFTERFSKWGSAEEAFKFWAERLRKFMDSYPETKK